MSYEEISTVQLSENTSRSIGLEGEVTFSANSAGKPMFSRAKGPACINPSGAVSFWVDNNLHRTTGPAAITRNHVKVYYAYGKLYEQIAFFTKFGAY